MSLACIARTIAVCWGLAALSAATAALADTACDTIAFPATPLDAIHDALVKPGAHVMFVTGRGACPDETPACRETAYVVPGDLLLIGGTHGPYSCAYYGNGKSETAGWLPTARLQQQPAALRPRSAWLGTWHDGDSTLRIRQAGVALSVSARAYWPSKSDPDGHESHLDATATPSGTTLALIDPDDSQGCALTLGLRANMLVAHDNGACGGANVTLSGVYRR